MKQNFDSKYRNDYFKGKLVVDLLTYIVPGYGNICGIKKNFLRYISFVCVYRKRLYLIETKSSALQLWNMGVI